MISKLHIQNFRSIKELTIEPKNLCALLGANSTGKTNILKALSVLLGETYPTERAFTKDDFYKRDTDQEIVIEVTFEEPLDKCRLTSCETYGKEYCCPDKFIFRHTRNNAASFNTTFKVIDDQGREFWGSGEARDQLSFIFIPSDRNLEKQMNVTQWSLLGKILKRIDENFRKNPTGQGFSSLERKFREAMKEPKQILESEFEGDLDYQKFKTTFIEICQDNTRGLAQSFDLDLEIYDPLFYYKTIQIVGNEELGVFNVQELGSGVQNLVLLSLFRTYAKLMKDRAILAIEEPEIYLYPQAQRQLYNSFIALAYPAGDAAGTQIFYTTHNPNFVDAQRAEEVEMLMKDATRGTYRLKKSNIVTRAFLRENRFKIYTHFNTERNELFFARKVILVEGDSDKILISKLCEEKWKIDLNKEGVSIIECGGKGGVMYFIGVCRLLGIEDFYAIWDEDPGNPVEDEHGNFTSSIAEKKGWEIPGNLEDYLSGHFGKSLFRKEHKIQDAYEWASNVALEEIPTEFGAIKVFIESPSLREGGKEQKNKEDTYEPPEDPKTAYVNDIKVEDLPF